ncbi:hypothetical protein [Pseudoroseicyclus aestuarii]|uniref:Uncharacterized protein n=1 Tax=Pseudoroseicyclus aestuarii TaxID=1795041 RepID=A0A318SV27_9RHOB|nr:hypothetical protein [Pseudoroseicyclus aestuarii]PYE85463.1 hypothetical protein DFP88_101129 [Pseudoroseicyclus aestuarii]
MKTPQDDMPKKRPQGSARADRLKSALKANIARRKAQAAARKPQDAPGDADAARQEDS